MALFEELEGAPAGTARPLADVIAAIPFDAAGLVPAVVQDSGSRHVLMLAWMNRAAIEETLQTGRVCYWSRSRRTLWRKGETSGHTQRLVAMHLDCDGDAILVEVDQTGPACHTNRRSCFYLTVDGDHISVSSDPV